MKQQIAGSKGMNTKPEECEVCKKSFKSARGVKIHQGKSGCKVALGQNRFVKSKPVAGDFQESHHRDFSSKNLASRQGAANTSSTKSLDTCSEEPVYDRNTAPTLSQEITKRIRELRKEAEILVIDDDIEIDIQNSILVEEEEAQRTAGRRREIENESQNEIIVIEDVNEKEIRESIMEPETLESDEEVIGIEDIEIIEDFTRMIKEDTFHKNVNRKQYGIKRPQAVPKDQKNLREWVKPDSANISWKDVHNFFCKGDMNEVISSGTFTLRRRDYRSLVGRNYVNDLVIEEYFDMIVKRNHEENLSTIGATSVFLYKRFDEGNFEEVFRDTERWNSKTDLRQCDIVLCPIHKRDHWSLVSIDIRRKTINYYDSIVGNRRASNAPRTMKRYIEEYYRSRGERQIFQVKIKDDAPIQTNGVDCGVFVCQNAEKIARGVYVNTRQEEMPEARKRMMSELYHRKIMTPGTARPQSLAEVIKTDTRKVVDISSRKLSPKRKTEARRTIELSTTQSARPRKAEIRSRAIDEKDKRTVIKKQESGTRKQEIDWPKTNSSEWKSFDEDVSKRLIVIMASPEKKAESHPNIIYNMGVERFGVVEKKRATTRGPSRRQKCMSALRKEIKKLDRAVKSAPEEEREGIQLLQKDKLRDLRLKKRAENVRKNRQKFRKNCNEFLSQPYNFSRNLINPKPKGQLKSSKEEVESHLSKVHSDAKREDLLEMTEEMWEHQEPDMLFNNKPPTYLEFMKKLRKTRTKSAPGPNGVPYKVYKRCPEVAKLLYQYLRSMWIKNVISDTWRVAEGVFIPKVEKATSVEKFRTISLLNVEGKLFFALKSERIMDFVLANEYIDTSIQKGGVPGISGCLEHTTIISQLIREAKKEKKSLVVTWLDIANAYGSIPHKLIMRSLKEAHIPEEVISMVENYYSNARIRFATQNFTTEWQRVEKGIITGCTLSVALFSLAMTWVVMSVKKETKGPKLSSGNVQVNSRLLMDDITTTTETMVQTSYLLNKLIRKLHWAGLYEKVEKCRALVIIKGVVSERKIEINGNPIQSIQEEPVRFLGKWYNATLNEKSQIEGIVKGVKDDLKKVDKCRLPGRYKAWMIQHMLMPRLMWPLSIYNVPMTTIEVIQKMITQSLKRWLGLPRTLSTACFYSRTAKLQFPYSELTEEVKAAKARNLVTLEESKDECIKGATLTVDGGRNANTPKAVEEAKANLRMKDITGTGNKGLEGLGLRRSQYFYKANTKEKREMIVKEIREKEEDRRRVRIVGQGRQGAMTRWEVPEHRLSHKEILGTTETRIAFLTKAVYDLLPTPANKSKWYGEDERCNLCNERGTLNHILTGCKTALSQGRYTWRHNKVLLELFNRIHDKAKVAKIAHTRTKRIEFVKEGEKKSTQEPCSNSSYLSSANDWQVRVDLNGGMKIPSSITVTNLRPDMILLSESTKQLGIIELTVPSENRIEVSSELKKAKYAPLAEEAKQKGWRVRIWAVEVGCKGFPARSMTVLLRDMGYTGRERKDLLRRIGETAEEASRLIWRWSSIRDWGKDKTGK